MVSMTRMASWTQYVCATLYTMDKPATLEEVMVKMERLFPEVLVTKTRSKVVSAVLVKDGSKSADQRTFKCIEDDNEQKWLGVAVACRKVIDRMVVEFKDSTILDRFLHEIKIFSPKVYNELIVTKSVAGYRSKSASNLSLITPLNQTPRNKSSSSLISTTVNKVPKTYSNTSPANSIHYQQKSNNQVHNPSIVHPPPSVSRPAQAPAKKVSSPKEKSSVPSPAHVPAVNNINRVKEQSVSSSPHASTTADLIELISPAKESNKKRPSTLNISIPTTNNSNNPPSCTSPPPNSNEINNSTPVNYPNNHIQNNSESSGGNISSKKASNEVKVKIENKYFGTLEEIVKNLNEEAALGEDISEKICELTACIQEAKIFTECAIEERDNIIEKLREEVKKTRKVIVRFPVWSQKITNDVSAGRKYQVFPTLRTCTIKVQSKADVLNDIISSVPTIIKVTEKDNSTFIETSCLCKGEGKCATDNICSKLKRQKIDYTVSFISNPRLKVFHNCEIPSELVLDLIHQQHLSKGNKPKLVTSYSTTSNRKCTSFECSRIEREEIAGKTVNIEGVVTPILDTIRLKLCTNCGAIGHFRKECNIQDTNWDPKATSCAFCRDNNQHHPFSTACPRIQRAIAAKLNNINYGADTGEHVLLWKWERVQRGDDRGSANDGDGEASNFVDQRGSKRPYNRSGIENRDDSERNHQKKASTRGRRNSRYPRRSHYEN